MRAQTPAAPHPPPEVKAGSITCDECPYPYPTSYLPFTLNGQEVRLAYMDVPPAGPANGHVVLFHGMNFAGFYWGGPIEALRKQGFRVVVPDQIGFGRSSKPVIPYNFHDMAANTHRVLQQLKIERVMLMGHWAHIKAPTLAFGGAEDSLAGPAKVPRGPIRRCWRS